MHEGTEAGTSPDKSNVEVNPRISLTQVRQMHRHNKTQRRITCQENANCSNGARYESNRGKLGMRTPRPLKSDFVSSKKKSNGQRYDMYANATLF
jgi:hypothetical protein